MPLFDSASNFLKYWLFEKCDRRNFSKNESLWKMLSRKNIIAYDIIPVRHVHWLVTCSF